MIYIIKQEGLYQNKFNSSLASIHNCKMAYYVMVVSKTKHSKTKTEARSTQNSKTKHPNLENEAPYLENEALKTRKRRPLNLENENSKPL